MFEVSLNKVEFEELFRFLAETFCSLLFQEINIIFDSLICLYIKVMSSLNQSYRGFPIQTCRINHLLNLNNIWYL